MNRKGFHDYILSSPINFVLVMTLYALASAFFPYNTVAKMFGDTYGMLQIFFIIFKIIFCILPIIVYLFVTSKIRIVSTYNIKPLILLPFLVVCVCNFPIFTLLINAKDTTWLSNEISLWLIHIFKCLSISVFEEFVFRGIILVLLLYIFRNKKYKIISSILISSAIFALTHLSNLASGMSLGSCLFQVSYTFLTGAMFAISFVISKKIAVPILLHFVYDFGGLLVDNMILRGEFWSTLHIVIYAIVSVAAIILALYLLIKSEFNCKEIKDEGYSSKS